MDRRQFLQSSLFAAAGVAGVSAYAWNKWSPRFQYVMLQVGQHWRERERALVKLSYEVQKRCNIPVEAKPATMSPGKLAQTYSPFFIISGKGAFDIPSREACRELRQILLSGGLLLFDHTGPKSDDDFFKTATALMNRVFPELDGSRPVPSDHALYQSYYLLREPRGRFNRNDYLEGWTLRNRTMAFFSYNDLLGAMEADKLGNWKYSMEIGGGLRRELCFRLGINLTYYTLTLNYKKDRAFPPIIERRRRI